MCSYHGQFSTYSGISTFYTKTRQHSSQPCFKFLKALDKQRRMNYPFNSVAHALTKDSVFGTRHFLIILCGMQSRASKRWEFSPFREMYCFMGIREVSLKYLNCREMKTNEQTNRQGNTCSKLMKVNLLASNCPSKIQMELLMINSGLDISQERKYPRKPAKFNWLSLIYPLVSSIYS